MIVPTFLVITSMDVEFDHVESPCSFDINQIQEHDPKVDPVGVIAEILNNLSEGRIGSSI